MSRRCQLTGRGTRVGRRIARRGLAKAKGGVGLKTTGHAKRTFQVNLQKKRLWVPELGRFVRVKLATRTLKTLARRRTVEVLRAAGLLERARR